MARSKRDDTAREGFAALLETPTEVRYFRLPGGGLSRMECSPPGAGRPPQDGEEIDADTYTRENDAAQAALEQRLAEIADTEQKAVRAHREQLAELGITGDLADALLGRG